MTNPTPTPVLASLSLSASIFTSSIDSWIPAKFGPKPSEIEQNAQFEKRLRDASLQGEHENLGVGHPDIGIYKPKGPSLISLEKKLGKIERGSNKAEREKEKEKDILSRMEVEVDSEEDEESRSKSVSSTKKRSNGIQDLLLGKKKHKSKVDLGQRPLLNLTPKDSSISDKTGETLYMDIKGTPLPPTPLTATTSSPGGSGDFPFPGPVALDSPRAQRVLDEKLFKKRLRAEEDDEDVVKGGEEIDEDDRDHDHDHEHATQSSSQGTSKSAKRREARKRAKLAKTTSQS